MLPKIISIEKTRIVRILLNYLLLIPLFKRLYLTLFYAYNHTIP